MALLQVKLLLNIVALTAGHMLFWHQKLTEVGEQLA
jgi:hypothetical protein